jgi:uncharacterized protein YjiK
MLIILLPLVWSWASPDLPYSTVKKNLHAEPPEIKGYDFSSKATTQCKLPTALAEASGLAFTSDGRLLCHDDEKGIIYEIDHKSGKIVKRFYLGRIFLERDDFEGIATKKGDTRSGKAGSDTIFLVNSSGTILRFLEGKDKEHVSFQTFKTPLTTKNNVEGLAYDPVTDCLLLACKGDAGKGYKDDKAVYAFSLKTYKLLPKPRFLLSLNAITKQTGEKEFNPSAIERHPVTGHFFVLAFNGHAMVEMDADGNLVGVSSLPKSVNPQPEGLAIAADGTMVICNEGQGKAGLISVYPHR